MIDIELKVTYIGGPTALLELGGVRIITDPTFDPGGAEYPTDLYTLRKKDGPAVEAKSLGKIDAVLLSHDHHFDNLDRAGRALLENVETVITTAAGAQHLGGKSFGFSPWDQFDLNTKDDRTLRIVGTPARHGPADGDRGPVTGFVLFFTDAPQSVVYISGDTVWYEGVAEVARRFPVKIAFLFMGAARVREVGPAHLTFTAVEAVEAARVFQDSVIIPLHFEDWEHFSESRQEIEKAFVSAGLDNRLEWLKRGTPSSFLT